MQKLYRQDTNEEVELPADLESFRGETEHVLGIFEEASPGKSGKLSVRMGEHANATRYPQVFGCYLAVEPLVAV